MARSDCRRPTRLPLRVSLASSTFILAPSSPPLDSRTCYAQRYCVFRLSRFLSSVSCLNLRGLASRSKRAAAAAPADMFRHILGEDLNVGCVLSWGPCWYHQKQLFDGQTSSLSKNRTLMRYDVEVSGFPLSHAGHLCLLNLKEDDHRCMDSLSRH